MLETNSFKGTEQGDLNKVLQDVGKTLCNDLQNMFQKNPSSVLDVLDQMRGSSNNLPGDFASSGQLLTGLDSSGSNADALGGCFSPSLAAAPDYNFGMPESAQAPIIINIFEGAAPQGMDSGIKQAASLGDHTALAKQAVSANPAMATDKHAAAPHAASQAHSFGAMDYVNSAAKLVGKLQENFSGGFSGPQKDPLAGIGDLLKTSFGSTGTGGEIGGILGGLVNGIDKSLSPNYKAPDQVSSGLAQMQGIGKNLNGLGGGLNNIGSLFNSGDSGAGGNLSSLFDGTDSALSSVSDTASQVVDTASNAVGDLGNLAGDAAGNIGDLASSAAGGIGDLAGEAAGGVGDLVGEIAPAAFALF